jgi:hypothetical protein
MRERKKDIGEIIIGSAQNLRNTSSTLFQTSCLTQQLVPHAFTSCYMRYVESAKL